MASRSFAEEDLSCPVCCDIFINPVILSCSHSFCSSCIQRVWENKTLKECPVCRKTSSNDCPPVNLALKNLCESFQQERSQKSSSEGETVCRDHNEKLKLFCLDDQQPVCLVCRDSRKHTNHRFCPVDEAVADKKEILKASLESLQEELSTSVNREQNLCKTAEEIKCHAQSTETQIKDEFEELHQFLHDEEAARITALREEEEKRSQMMKEKIEETRKQISSLTITIRDIEEQMKAEDVSFLQNFEATLQRAQYIPDPDPSPSVSITFTDHLTNLKLNVLQKMQDNVGKREYDRTQQWCLCLFVLMSVYECVSVLFLQLQTSISKARKKKKKKLDPHSISGVKSKKKKLDPHLISGGGSKKKKLDPHLISGGGSKKKKKKLDPHLILGGGSKKKKKKLDQNLISGGGSKKKKLDQNLISGGGSKKKKKKLDQYLISGGESKKKKKKLDQYLISGGGSKKKKLDPHLISGGGSKKKKLDPHLISGGGSKKVKIY